MSVCKECNVKRHYETKHVDRFDTFIGIARRDKMAEFQKDCNIQQSVVVRAKNESEGTASYLASELIARNSRSFSDAAFVKQCMSKVTETIVPDKRAAFANASFKKYSCTERY